MTLFLSSALKVLCRLYALRKEYEYQTLSLFVLILEKVARFAFCIRGISQVWAVVLHYNPDFGTREEYKRILLWIYVEKSNKNF